jgi:hypothetical protein
MEALYLQVANNKQLARAHIGLCDLPRSPESREISRQAGKIDEGLDGNFANDAKNAGADYAQN